VIDSAYGQPAEAAGLAAAFSAARARLALIGLLFVLGAIAWWFAADLMRGMDNGPGTDLGALGWFVGVWVVMMGAMMFPSVAPTVALYARMTKARSPSSPFVFAGGYLLTWAAAGVAAYAVGKATSTLLGDDLQWGNAGRAIAGTTLLAAAVYELTPLKDVCLGKCRSPLGMLLGSWRDGGLGALRMGVKNGAWCVGCCWGLMASLFALGVMSVIWMAVVAGLIATEKTLPWGRPAACGTAVVMLALGVMLLAAPSALPGLTIPHGGGMSTMLGMGS
jgi:predicted metal-binding membrane protein